VELAGKTFTGNPGKTKKQAQKNAAMAAWSELKQLPRVGEPSSSSCPLDQDDEEHEQAIVTRTLASLNQANVGKMPHQKEKQQGNNRPSSRRSYPKSNPSFYRSHLPNQAYPSVPPEAMYHMWHRVQATQPAPSFPMVPTMGNTRFPPPPAMLSMYSSPRGQFATPACQDALGLLPCFPEGAPALPRYFSPYPVSYVPRSPVPDTVHKIHERRQDLSETVELPDAVVFSQYGGPHKFQEPPKNGKEDCTGSSASPEEEIIAPLSISGSTTHPSSPKLDLNEEKETLGSKPIKSQEQQLKSSPPWISPSNPAHVSNQPKHYTSSVQHDEIHRNDPPQTSRPSLPELWSSLSAAAPRSGTAVPVNSPGHVYQQRPPWLAAPVTVRTAIPVCSARPNAVNTACGAARVRPMAQNRLALARGEPETAKNTNNGERALNREHPTQ